MMDIDTDQLGQVLSKLREQLLSMRNDQGHWRGELSSSALATATAVGALALTDGDDHQDLIDSGLKWLCDNVNEDGGWGDTAVSQSNISTTILCWAVFGMAGADEKYPDIVAGAEKWLTDAAGGIAPKQLADAIYDRYGDDRTFAVPILTMCALAGRLGDDPWEMIVPLPFELAVFPHRFYKILNLSVVSYALAALIAIGQVHFHHHQPSNWFTSKMRNFARGRTLKKLEEIQPDNGGFLEAITLTSFVVMSLVSVGQKDHTVVKKGISFICSTVRPDGSWPIDTDLATWLTTLSVNSLSQGTDFDDVIDNNSRSGILKWLMDQQYKEKHPYVNADPGGWAWTDKPGGVPDADDTAGAIIALKNLAPDDEDAITAARKGLKWLMKIQNKDGGIPTFCKGWKDLPFDRSSPDLTAHALAAMGAWAEKVDTVFAGKIKRSAVKAIAFLQLAQQQDGSWIPLWFGNESADSQHNPTYGTARVLLGLAEAGPALLDQYCPMIVNAVKFLVKIQNEDGGWGGDHGVESSIEETALATDALAVLLGIKVIRVQDDFKVGRVEAAVEGGALWLIDRLSSDQPIKPSPIGLYFASLWYHEKLYPWIFSYSALQRVADLSG